MFGPPSLIPPPRPLTYILTGHAIGFRSWNLYFRFIMGLFCLSFCFCFRCWSFIESCWFWCCFLYYKEQHFQNGWDSNTEPQDDSKLLSYEARIIQGDQKKLGPKLLSLLPLKTVKNWWNKLHFKIWTLTLDMSKFEMIRLIFSVWKVYK